MDVCHTAHHEEGDIMKEPAQKEELAYRDKAGPAIWCHVNDLSTLADNVGSNCHAERNDGQERWPPHGWIAQQIELDSLAVPTTHTKTCRDHGPFCRSRG